MKELLTTLMKRLTKVATTLNIGLILWAILFGVIEGFESRQVMEMLGVATAVFFGIAIANYLILGRLAIWHKKVSNNEVTS